MMNEVRADSAKSAIYNYEQAQNVSLEASASFLRRFNNGGRGSPCPTHVRVHDLQSLKGIRDAKGELSSYQEFHNSMKPEVYPPYRSNAGFVVSSKGVSLYGKDGVVAKQNLEPQNCRLDVYSASSWPFLDIQGNFWLEETWKKSPKFEIYDNFDRKYPQPDPSKTVAHIKEAASVMQYAADNYYHFVMEVMPRILLLRGILEAHPEMKLIVPKDTSSNQFITAYLSLFDWIPSSRILPYKTNGPPGERVKVDELFWAEWPKVESETAVTTHCLAPAQNLRETRDALRDAFGFSADPNNASAVAYEKVEPVKDPMVLYLARTGASMRRLEGEEVEPPIPNH